MIRCLKTMAASVPSAAIFFCLTGVLTVFHPAQAQSQFFADDEARRAIIELRTRVELLLGKVAQFERQLQTASQNQIQLLNENERLLNEVARLRGQIEEAGRAVTIGKDQQKDLYTDLDKRLRALEPVAINVDGLQYRVSIDEKNQFDEVRELLKTGNFKKTVEVAETFERYYPNSLLAAAVLLNKGTALYADSNHKAAIQARQDFLDRYPNHPARAQVMLNLAASQEESGNPSTARVTLENLIRLYPNSASAAEARERIKTLPKPPPPPPAPPPSRAPSRSSGR